MKFLMGLLAALFMVGTAHAGKQGQKGPKGPQFIMMNQDAADTKSHFWNLKVGNVVNFDNVFNTQAGEVKGPEVAAEVTKNADGVCVLKTSAAGRSSEMVMGSKDGYYCWGSLADGKFDAKMRMFKYGAKVGDSWDGWAGEKVEGASEVTVKYVGLETVKVPAGEYKDVVHVQAVVTDGPTLDYYFAPKVGMIKFTMTQDGEVRRRLEMTSFTEGK